MISLLAHCFPILSGFSTHVPKNPGDKKATDFNKNSSSKDNLKQSSKPNFTLNTAQPSKQAPFDAKKTSNKTSASSTSSKSATNQNQARPNQSQARPTSADHLKSNAGKAGVTGQAQPRATPNSSKTSTGTKQQPQNKTSNPTSGARRFFATSRDNRNAQDQRNSKTSQRTPQRNVNASTQKTGAKSGVSARHDQWEGYDEAQRENKRRDSEKLQNSGKNSNTSTASKTKNNSSYAADVNARRGINSAPQKNSNTPNRRDSSPNRNQK